VYAGKIRVIKMFRQATIMRRNLRRGRAYRRRVLHPHAYLLQHNIHMPFQRFGNNEQPNNCVAVITHRPMSMSEFLERMYHMHSWSNMVRVKCYMQIKIVYTPYIHNNPFRPAILQDYLHHHFKINTIFVMYFSRHIPRENPFDFVYYRPSTFCNLLFQTNDMDHVDFLLNRFIFPHEDMHYAMYYLHTHDIVTPYGAYCIQN